MVLAAAVKEVVQVASPPVQAKMTRQIRFAGGRFWFFSFELQPSLVVEWWLLAKDPGIMIVIFGSNVSHPLPYDWNLLHRCVILKSDSDPLSSFSFSLRNGGAWLSLHLLFLSVTLIKREGVNK